MGESVPPPVLNWPDAWLLFLREANLKSRTTIMLFAISEHSMSMNLWQIEIVRSKSKNEIENPNFFKNSEPVDSLWQRGQLNAYKGHLLKRTLKRNINTSRCRVIIIFQIQWLTVIWGVSKTLQIFGQRVLPNSWPSPSWAKMVLKMAKMAIIVE